jgi:hypothetical protein
MMVGVGNEQQMKVMLPEISTKRWWERPVGIVTLGVLITVVGTLIAWLITRHYDTPTPATATQSQPQLQPAQPGPTPAPATAPPSQAAPAKKSPSQNAQHAKPQQDNSVHIGDHASVSQSSTGDCSPNIIGGSPTVNCGPPPPPPLQYTWSVQDVKPENPAHKFAKTITVQTNVVVEPVFIGVTADEEIEELTVCCGIFFMQSVGHDTSDKRRWFVSFDSPAFRPNKPFLLTAYSEKPVSILAITPTRAK